MRVPVVHAPFDTVGQNGDVPSPDTTVVAPAPRSHTAAPPGSLPTEPVPTETSVAPLDSVPLAAAAPAVSIDLPPAEREELLIACLSDLGVADSLLAVSSPGAAEGGEDRVAAREKEATVRGFVAQARSAIDRDDLEAAANLARKARLLAEELGLP